VLGFTEKETPTAGPSPLPLIVMISPGTIGPDAPLAELVTDVTNTRGLAALTVSDTEIVFGLSVAPRGRVVYEGRESLTFNDVSGNLSWYGTIRTCK
jgi:hypothetical protein